MRTKTLILTAALGAACVATPMAQVFSVNAVGYVNKTLNPGLNLIANPLVAQNNTVAGLFADLTSQGIALQVYKFTSTGSYVIYAYDPDFEEWSATGTGNAATDTFLPGEGLFVRSGSANNVTLTFVGEVRQGTLETQLNGGGQLSLVASQVPQRGTATELAYVPTEGDQVYKFLPNGPGGADDSYYIAAFEFEEWDKAEPIFEVGEGFFVRRATAGTWTRTFSVNQ